MSTTAEDDAEIHVIANVITTTSPNVEAPSKGTDATCVESPPSNDMGAAVPAEDAESDGESSGTGGSYARIIVVGMDGSAQSYHAFHWYISNMHMDGNYVILVHAFELPLLHSFQQMYVSPDMWQATLKREARCTENMEKRLRGVLNRCKIPGRFEARGGRPGEVLVTVAEECSADVVIVGTRGHSKLHRAVLGSVSGYVTDHAPCPVIICRQKGRVRTDSAGSQTSIGSTGRTRHDSANSTGSRGSQGSRVRFDMSEQRSTPCRPRHHSTGSADDRSDRKKSTSLFKSILSRRRNKSESYCDRPSGDEKPGTTRQEERSLIAAETESSS